MTMQALVQVLMTSVGCVRWCIPYEYNNGDLTACILFLEKHLYAGAISWPTFQ